MVLTADRAAAQTLRDRLELDDVTTRDLAGMTGAELVGPDQAVRHLRPLSIPADPDSVTWLGSPAYVDDFARSDMSAVFTTPAIADLLVREGSRPMLVHPHPKDAFFAAHLALVDRSRYPILPDRRGTGCRVAGSAVIHDGVDLGDDVTIGDHVTIHTNSVLGDGVIVQDGAVIGGDGFQIGLVDGRRRVIPHIGGVALGDGVSVGNGTMFDKGLFSTFTTAGSEAMFDNLIHVGHDAMIGARATVVAGGVIGGLVSIGDDAWFGLGAVANQLLTLGRGSYVGSAAMVTRDVPPFTLVYGNPAKPAGEVCLCRARLDGSDSPRCGSCGTSYLRADGRLAIVA
jgi:UDP-3-O-[3-hydroxymyristoyl] glucosamine N-acyltransferase